VAALVDTNVLVYRFDPRFPEKQDRANELLRHGIANDSLRVPHQAIVEFVSATTRPRSGGIGLLSPEDARREAEELLSEDFQHDRLYGTVRIVNPFVA
jgi:predicted nucleic acid-binding protein